MSFKKLQEKFNNKLIGRDDYWRLASDIHMQLLDYSESLNSSDVESIIINKDGLFLTLHSGVSLIWDPADIRSSSNTIVNHKVHEDYDGELLIAAAKYATCIFDIGANAGYYSLQFAKKYSSIKSVHAFEPIQKTYKTLLKNVNLNNLNKKIICQPFGLGDCDKKVEFYIPGFSGSVAASMENLHPEENNEVEMVNIITLDKYCIDNNISELDLMKIDVEGSESFVLKGAMASLNKFKPTIFIEILRKWSRMFGVEPNKNFHDLVKMGYECWAVQDGRLQAFTHMTEDTIQTNFFFIHADRKSEFNHLFN